MARATPARRARWPLLALATLLYAATLATGGQGTRAASADVPGCVYADVAGMPGEGCGAQTDSSLLGTSAVESRGCVYADVWGVPGEGCGASTAGVPVR